MSATERLAAKLGKSLGELIEVDCSACGRKLPHDEFSRSQQDKAANGKPAKCRDCMRGQLSTTLALRIVVVATFPLTVGSVVSLPRLYPGL